MSNFSRPDRPRWMQMSFRLSTMFLVLSVLCVLFAYWGHLEAMRRQRSIADGAIENELLKIHWRADQDRHFQAFASQWATALASGSTTRVSFMLPNGKTSNGSTPDKFETQLLSNWSSAAHNGAGEVANRNSLIASPFVFYKAIRATNICVGCHAAIQPMGPSSLNVAGPPLSTGDLVGIAKVVFP